MRPHHCTKRRRRKRQFAHVLLLRQVVYANSWSVQVEALEVYEPAVAEEEALPEPEAAPAPKGENVCLSVGLPQCLTNSCVCLVPCIADHTL